MEGPCPQDSPSFLGCFLQTLWFIGAITVVVSTLQCSESPLKRSNLSAAAGKGRERNTAGHNRKNAKYPSAVIPLSMRLTYAPSSQRDRKEKKVLPGLLWHEGLFPWLMGLKVRAVWKESTAVSSEFWHLSKVLWIELLSKGEWPPLEGRSRRA